MFSFVDAYEAVPSWFVIAIIACWLLPKVAVTLLSVYAAVMALSARKERAERARTVLVHLLDALRALCHRRRGRGPD